MTGAERANLGGPGRDFPEAPLHRGEEWQRVAENERPGKPVPRRLPASHAEQSFERATLLLFEGPGGKIAGVGRKAQPMVGFLRIVRPASNAARICFGSKASGSLPMLTLSGIATILKL